MKKIIIIIAILFPVSVFAAWWNPFSWNEKIPEQGFGTDPRVFTVKQGGTGASTFSAGECLVGNGTGAITSQSCAAGTGNWATSSTDFWETQQTPRGGAGGGYAEFYQVGDNQQPASTTAFKFPFGTKASSTSEFNGIINYGSSTSTGHIASLGGNSDQWNLAFSWGNHSLANYLTGNQSITLSGDISGTGATAITTTIGADRVNDLMIDWGTGANQVSSADVTEQTNLYYLDSRVATYINASNTMAWGLCANNEILKFNGTKWICSADATGGGTGSNWLYFDNNTLAPSTTGKGIFVYASSTFNSDLRVNGNTTSTDVNIPAMSLAGSDYDSVNDWLKLLTSAGRVTGGVITDAGSGKVNISAGNGWFRLADDDISQVKLGNWAASSTVDISATSTLFIGVEYNSGSPRITSNSTGVWDYDTAFPLGRTIKWDGEIHILNNFWWTGDSFTNIIERFESEGNIVRDNRTGGLQLGTNGRYLTLTQGTLLSRLSEFDIGAKDTTGVGDTFQIYYRDGGSSWLRASSAARIFPNTQYDDNSGVLATMNNNYYSNLWVYADAESDLYMVYGQDEYNSAAGAEAEAAPSSVPALITNDGILIGRIIFKKSATVASSVQSAFTTFLGTTLASDHGNLAGLTDDDHTQYYLADGTRAGTGAHRLATINSTSTNIGTLNVYTGSTFPANDITDAEVVDTITATNYVRKNTWTDIDSYPTGCLAGQYVSTIGDTLTCSLPSLHAGAWETIWGTTKRPTSTTDGIYLTGSSTIQTLRTDALTVASTISLPANSITDAMVPDNITITETDPQVGTLTNGDMCTNDGSALQCTVNTEAEFETAMDGLNFILNTEIDTSAELAAILGDEDGSGLCGSGLFCTGGHEHSWDNLLSKPATSTPLNLLDTQSRIATINATTTNIGTSLIYGSATTTLSQYVKQLTVGDLTASNCDVKALTTGVFYCGTDATGGAGGDPGSWSQLWANTLAPTSTSSGFYSYGSSTVKTSFRVDGKATTTLSQWIGTGGTANWLDETGGDLFVQDDVQIGNRLNVGGLATTSTTTIGAINGGGGMKVYRNNAESQTTTLEFL